MRTCSNCGIPKSNCEFGHHPKSKDGFLSKCKLCTSLLKNDVRIKNIEEIKADPRAKEILKRVSIKTIAQLSCREAIKDGSLVRGECEVCGTNDKTEGHHDDYSKPLDVRWLCRKHHSQWHSANGEGANGYDLTRLETELYKLDLEEAKDEIQRLRTLLNISKFQEKGYIFVKASDYKKTIDDITRAMDS